MRAFLLILCASFMGCVGVPQGIEPVQNFEVDRYLGKWHELARLDHSFERGLQSVTAEYSVRDDGGLRVINRGFDTVSDSWDEAEGKAYFVGSETTGHLKVSFFGPFYGSYVIFELGQDYEYSLVTSADRSYFWLLSRTKKIGEDLKAEIVERIAALGFDTRELIFVSQNMGL